jgi:hypothetical protein
MLNNCLLDDANWEISRQLSRQLHSGSRSLIYSPVPPKRGCRSPPKCVPYRKLGLSFRLRGFSYGYHHHRYPSVRRWHFKLLFTTTPVSSVQFSMERLSETDDSENYTTIAQDLRWFFSGFATCWSPRRK